MSVYPIDTYSLVSLHCVSKPYESFPIVLPVTVQFKRPKRANICKCPLNMFIQNIVHVLVSVSIFVVLFTKIINILNKYQISQHFVFKENQTAFRNATTSAPAVAVAATDTVTLATDTWTKSKHKLQQKRTDYHFAKNNAKIQCNFSSSVLILEGICVSTGFQELSPTHFNFVRMNVQLYTENNITYSH